METVFLLCKFCYTRPCKDRDPLVFNGLCQPGSNCFVLMGKESPGIGGQGNFCTEPFEKLADLHEPRARAIEKEPLGEFLCLQEVVTGDDPGQVRTGKIRLYPCGARGQNQIFIGEGVTVDLDFPLASQPSPSLNYRDLVLPEKSLDPFPHKGNEFGLPLDQRCIIL